MIEQDGFVTKYDSHEKKPAEPTSPTQLMNFKFEADMVYTLAKAMYDRTKTEEFKQCFGDTMAEADFNAITSEVSRLYNQIGHVRHEIKWYEGRAKALGKEEDKS